LWITTKIVTLYLKKNFTIRKGLSLSATSLYELSLSFV
jgi:hypothetical protein